MFSLISPWNLRCYFTEVKNCTTLFYDAKYFQLTSFYLKIKERGRINYHLSILLHFSINFDVCMSP